MTILPPSILSDSRRSGRTLGSLLGIPTCGGPEDDAIEGETRKITLPLRAVDVRASLAGDCAITELTERYANASDTPLDVLHTIPIPASCAVIGFEIRAGSRVVRGVCRTRKAAKAEYEHARSRGYSAAIIESIRDDLHRISLANVPPRTEITVTLRLAERLSVHDGRFEYRLPTALSPKYVPGDPIGHAGHGVSPDTDQAPDASDLTPPLLAGIEIPVSLEVRIAPGVTQILPSIALNTRQDADGTSVLTPSQPLHCSGDLVIRFWNRVERTAMRAYTDGQRTLVVLDPPAVRTPALERTREAVFVLDRSGSMQGTRIEAAKRALVHALCALKPTDLLEVIAFDCQIERFHPNPVLASPQHVAAAVAWVQSLQARGGTEAVPALKAACTPPRAPDHVRTVLVITDGDLCNDAAVLKLTAGLDPACRISALGIGQAPSAALLSRLARLGGGTCSNVQSEDCIDFELRSLDATLAGPIAYGVHEVGARPDRGTTDLFAGRGGSLFLDGPRRYVRVTSTDGSFTAECEVMPSPVALGPLWARAEVERLEDRRISHPRESKAIDGSIERLGLEHGIQTRMTAFVAVDEQSRVTGDAIEIVQPTPRSADGVRDLLQSPEASRATPIQHYQLSYCRTPQAGLHDSRFGATVMDLGSSCHLATSLNWVELAQALGRLEAMQQRLSLAAPQNADPALAATLLLMMLACAPERLDPEDLPEVLAALDLSRNGEPWRNWIRVLETMRGKSGWDDMLAAAARGDADGLARAGLALSPVQWWWAGP